MEDPFPLFLSHGPKCRGSQLLHTHPSSTHTHMPPKCLRQYCSCIRRLSWDRRSSSSAPVALLITSCRPAASPSSHPSPDSYLFLLPCRQQGHELLPHRRDSGSEGGIGHFVRWCIVAGGYDKCGVVFGIGICGVRPWHVPESGRGHEEGGHADCTVCCECVER